MARNSPATMYATPFLAILSILEPECPPWQLSIKKTYDPLEAAFANAEEVLQEQEVRTKRDKPKIRPTIRRQRQLYVLWLAGSRGDLRGRGNQGCHPAQAGE